VKNEGSGERCEKYIFGMEVSKCQIATCGQLSMLFATLIVSNQ
jgi:hypothetical protein